MALILLDTDVLIEILRGNEAIRDELSALYLQGEALAYSPVTKAEVYAGLRSPERRVTEVLFLGLQCCSIDEMIGEHAGYFLRSYHKSHGVELADALIAATAKVYQAFLFTLNRRHYPMPELRLYPARKWH